MTVLLSPHRAAATALAVAAFTLALAAQSPQPQPPPDTLTAIPVAAQRLAPGDRIDINVFEAPELATDVRLDAAGAITMPAAGRLVLSGDTAAEAGDAIAARLGADYLLHPQVQVLVRDFAPQPVVVLGAVVHPGVYSARAYPTLDAVVAAAGGIAPGAGPITFTPASAPAAEFTSSVPPAVAVHTGDVVRIAPQASVYVGGEVAHPGAYPMPASGLTLVEAITLAGGVLPDGGASHTRIVHRPFGQPATADWLDATPILLGRAKDRALASQDLVYVPHSAGRAALFGGITQTVATGTAILTGLIVFH